MPKHANPTSYTGRKGNNEWTGQVRFANQAEAEALVRDDLALSPATLKQALDDNYVTQTNVTLSSAQVLDLADTPVEIVPAPGADLFIEFISAKIILDYNSSAYTESADNLVIAYDDDSGVAVSDEIECTGFIDQTADTITNAVPIANAIVAAANCVNEPLVIYNNNANFAAGNSPLYVHVTYRIVKAGL